MRFMTAPSRQILDESASPRKADNDKVTLLYKRARNGAQAAKCLCYIALLVRSGMRRIGAAVAIAISGMAIEAQESSQRVDVVRVTGCLRRAAGDAWTLSGATDPVVITRENAATPPSLAAAAGTNEFKLIGIEEFDLASRKDRLVSVKGLLIKATPASRLNVTSVTTVADSCPAPKK
jgi:hypothetical protein